MSDSSPLFRSALELAELVRTRQVSPVELTQWSLDRIEAVDSMLNSFVLVDAEAALAAAKAAEASAGRDDTPLFHGVPIALKDLHLTSGMRTTFGTSSFAEFVPPFDEEGVARLRRAGFVFMGKTNVPEFGTVPYSESRLLGPARNPWNPDFTPGGSSGGAAAAVAAGLVPVAQASDGGGSIRIPASNCGLFGLKPSRGRVSNAPLFGDIQGGLATSGVVTRYVADSAAILDLMRGYVSGDPHWAPEPARPYLDDAHEDPAPLRVGLVTSSPIATFDPEALTVIERTGALLESLGHHVEPFSLPISEQLVEDGITLWAAGIAALPVDPTTLEPVNQYLHARGTATSAGGFLQAVTAIQLASRAVVGASLAYDVVVTSTLSRAPLRVGEFAGLEPEAAFRACVAYVNAAPLANLTGQPSMSVPLGMSTGGMSTGGSSTAGLPMGALITGRPADEATLFRLAGQLERTTDWPSSRPALI